MSTHLAVNPAPNTCSVSHSRLRVSSSHPTIVMVAGLNQVLWLATNEGTWLAAWLRARRLPVVQNGALFALPAREARYV